MSRKLSLKSVTMLLGGLVLSTGSLAQTTDANQHTSYASQGHEAQRSKALQLPSSDSAFKELFGVPVTGEKTQSTPNELSSFWFGQELNQRDEDYYAAFFVSQEIDWDISYDDHIMTTMGRETTADIGVVTYKKVSGQWLLVSKQKGFATTGQNGDVGNVDTTAPDLLALTPTATSILLDTIEGGQHTDYRVDKGKLMFIFSEEKWTHGGNILIGSSRDGVKEECGYPPLETDERGLGWCYKNTGEISVLDVFKNGFPAIFVTRTGTTAGQNSPVPAENLIYTFIDGRYQ